MDLRGRTAIITGSRRGIGRGIALRLAEARCNVVICDLDQRDCQTVLDEARAYGVDGLALQADITKRGEVQGVIDETVRRFGRIDILVNNAGIICVKPFLELTDEEWDNQINVNLKATFYCSQLAARQMAKAKRGKIVNIASISGQMALKDQSAYAVSKAGVIMLTRCLARELARYRINVNCVSPGPIETPMTQELYKDPETREKVLKIVPWHEIGKPRDIGDAVLFLASDASDYITGALLTVDGGWMQGYTWLPFE